MSGIRWSCWESAGNMDEGPENRNKGMKIFVQELDRVRNQMEPCGEHGQEMEGVLSGNRGSVMNQREFC